MEKDVIYDFRVLVGDEIKSAKHNPLERVTVKDFQYLSFRCKVVRVPLGHLCGYVSVEQNSQFFGVHYRDLPSDFHSGVNGGITYSEQEGEVWTFGFDYAHWINDPLCGEGFVPGTVANVTDDCIKLATALYRNRDRTFVLELEDDDYSSETMPGAIILRNQRYEPVF